MMSSWTVLVQRPTSDVPWGLRIRGGSDCSQPLTIHKIRKRSPAVKAGLEVGLVITTVEGRPSDHLTHAQVLELLASQRLSITFTVTRRQFNGPMQKSVSSTNQYISSPQQAPAILAYLPIAAQPTSYPNVFVPAPLTVSADGFYKTTHRSPPFRPVQQQPERSYQPFDMTGKNAFYSPTPQPPVHRFYESLDAVRTSQYPVSYQPTMMPPASVLSPEISAPANPTRPTRQPEQSWLSTRTPEYFEGIENDRDRVCAQSRSFRIIEAALNEQGSGEQGLPPPRSLSREQRHDLYEGRADVPASETPVVVADLSVSIARHRGGTQAS